jgi:hypothetical protein
MQQYQRGAKEGSGFGIKEQEWARDSVSKSKSWLGIAYQGARVCSGYGIKEQESARDSVSKRSKSELRSQ